MVFEQYIPNDYIRALIIFLVLVFALRVAASILERVILRIVKKTKTELDDIIVEKSSVPLTILLILISLEIALNEIVLEQTLFTRIENTIYSLMIISIGYLIYVVIDVAIFAAWTQFAKKAKIDIGESLGSLIHSILKIILVIFIFLYLLNLWGVEITPLLAGLGIAGLAIALALQPALSNIFSGVSVILDKSIRV